MKTFYSRYKNIIKLFISLFLFFFIRYIQLIPYYILKALNVVIDEKISLVLSLFSNVVLGILLFLLFKNDLKKEFKKFKKDFWDISDVALKYWLIGLGVMGVANILISLLTPAIGANNEESVQSIIKSFPIFAFILTTFIAPFTEEIVFRKAFRGAIKEDFVYVVASGLFFGLMHVVSSALYWYDYLYVIPYGALGICFAIINVKTKNTFSSVFVHMLHNGTLTLVSILGVLL